MGCSNRPTVQMISKIWRVTWLLFFEGIEDTVWYYVMPSFVLQRNEKKSQPEIVIAVYHTSRSNDNLIMKTKSKLCPFLPQWSLISISQKWHTHFSSLRTWIDRLISRTGRWEDLTGKRAGAVWGIQLKYKIITRWWRAVQLDLQKVQ